ncbi:Cyanobacterial phytochrome B [Cyphellophora attinorum]|uniref:Cyanobacterial phytochrome B n=1 Tax=Cyphellophora attinorum TaxID=1664694 RepID=A0A0N1NZ41_9EURO|nr:Cyanobacterial phytochrome B [Phialophora attinorum]KPI39925.1 Cyanobacterial phytochrome B [Phialophora attinorum]
MLGEEEPDSDDGRSTKSGANASRASSVKNDAGILTARFKHVVTDGGHSVITGRDGDALQRCEDEPIHIPGAIQSFGLLIAFKEIDGRLQVRIVSENSAKIIGYSPAQLFRLDNFLDIFTEEQADNLLEHLDFIRDDEAADVLTNGPEVFMVSIRPPQHRTRKLWCAMHTAPSDKELIVCEFELEDDQANPLVSLDEGTPEPPEDTLGSKPTNEELAESTVNASKPLRVLRSARKKRGEAAAMEVFNIMSQVQEQMSNAPNLQIFLKVLIGVVKELSGFHRVMVYQFDHAWNGRVVAELVDPRATKDLYKGLNFPASDIPKQARDLYKMNKVRLLYDRDQETARLVCRSLEDLESPLDMSYGYLRAMSPIHIKYLGNMAVRSSMSISINAFDELWGLIACHSYGSKGMRVSFPIRKMCRLVGDTASRNIERLSYASRLQARKLINTTSSAANPSGYIVASSEDLLKLFDADIGALSIRDETKILGNPTGHLQEILAIVEYLRMRRFSAVMTSQDIMADFPDFKYAPGLKQVAGVLYVPLSGGGHDFITFFRKGVLQEVKWAGNPYEKFVQEGTEGYLEPRKSFKTWSETIVGRCRDWTEEEVETASVLCLVYGKFIEVWRQKEAALQNSQLTKLLLANSAHEVRTPLNHIINYLEIALEGALDNETRENLAKSHSASKSLVYVINDLLDLTKAEGGKDLVKEESFDLVATLTEATEPFTNDAKRKGLDYSVSINEALPRNVIGDARRVRQILSNLIANAIQHTKEGHVNVEVAPADATTDRVEVDIVVEDTGAGMSSSKVDALFRELEEVSYELEVSDSKMLENDPFSDPETPDKTTLGLGLAVVARTVRTMNGQLRLKTEEGKGSRFVIQLGFQEQQKQIQDKNELTPFSSPGKHLLAPPMEGEVTLINRAVSPRRGSEGAVLQRRASADSLTSLKSQKSAKSNNSDRSDADRLIDAIQQPLHLSETSPAGPRPDSKGGHSARLSNSYPSPEAISMSSPQRASSIGSSRELRTAFARTPGQEQVTDSGVPIRPVRLPEEDFQRDSERRAKEAGLKNHVKFQEDTQLVSSPTVEDRDLIDADAYRVLVAEDDPINSKIMKKRLEKLGHTPTMTTNGEECASAHGDAAASFDAVLMDLQASFPVTMPIVDGYSATKMIRTYEKTHAGTSLSPRASCNYRIPIFAVSASLVEKDRDKYMDIGFDGWLLKPVDFKRVHQMLKGVVDDETRDACIYRPGHWEQGGWFTKRERQPDAFAVSTAPSEKSPTSNFMAVADDEEPRASTTGSLKPRAVPEEGQ